MPRPEHSGVCGYGSHGIRESGYGSTLPGRPMGAGIENKRIHQVGESGPSMPGKKMARDRPSGAVRRWCR